MSLIEFIGESVNPGKTGDTKFGRRRRDKQPRIIVILRFIAALTLLGFTAYVIWKSGSHDLKRLGWFAGGISFYLLLGYLIHPEADEGDMGYLGIFDNPFRYSDDINRTLFFLNLILSPARFVSEAMVDGFVMIMTWKKGAGPYDPI